MRTLKKKAAGKRLKAVELWLTILNGFSRNCSLLSTVRTLFEKAASRRLEAVIRLLVYHQRTVVPLRIGILSNDQLLVDD
jgi:hypothetical protein